MRKVFALTGVLAVALTLSACSTDAATSGSSDCTNVAQPGDATRAVTVTGGFNEKPTVTFATPLQSDTTQRVVLEEGTGDLVADGQEVSINFSAYDGRTGTSLADTPYDDETYLTVSNKLSSDPAAGGALLGIVKAVQCLPIGSRVLVVTSPEDAFGDAGNAQLGVGPNSSLVIVADIVAASPTRATGVDQPAPDGFPLVVLDPTTGQPGVTMPSTAPPTETKIAVLKKGDGPVVGDNSDVTLQYSGFIWQTGEVFDSSWTRGTAATFNVNGVIQGFHDALVGQTVGSQVAVIIPPDQGYGANPPSGSSITADSTLFFVIDILSTKN